MIPCMVEPKYGPRVRINEGEWPRPDASPGENDAGWWTSFRYTYEFEPPSLGATITFVDGIKPALDVHLVWWHLQIGWFA